MVEENNTPVLTTCTKQLATEEIQHNTTARANYSYSPQFLGTHSVRSRCINETVRANLQHPKAAFSDFVPKFFLPRVVPVVSVAIARVVSVVAIVASPQRVSSLTVGQGRVLLFRSQ